MPREYDPKLVEKAVKTIQMLAVDGVEKANSGHPGTPMALASIAFEIWTRHLRYDPSDPRWPNRDRFVLSAGHASMLLYSLLHLAGFDLPIDELKRFRQFGSKTPGHPECFLTSGIEVTTGPLGQGISNAVGIAASIKMLAARFNTPETPVVKATKQNLGWPLEPTFLVPDEVRAVFVERGEEGKREHAAWNKVVEKLEKSGGEKAELYRKLMAREVPANLFDELLKVAPTKDAATREQSSVIEQKVAELVPSLAGGSADLNPSTKTYIKSSGAIARGKFDGRNVHFGIREHPMGAFVNGMASSEGFIP